MFTPNLNKLISRNKLGREEALTLTPVQRNHLNLLCPLILVDLVSVPNAKNYNAVQVEKLVLASRKIKAGKLTVENALSYDYKQLQNIVNPKPLQGQSIFQKQDFSHNQHESFGRGSTYTNNW